MTFYGLSDSTFTRHYREEVEMAFSTLECVLNGEKSIYSSTELTTGLRLYNAMRTCHVKTAAELKELKGKDWYTNNIWNANLRTGAEFASRIRAQLQGKTLVVTPGPFSAPGWTQPEYLAFWEQLLRTRINSVWFNLNWQYSNGCTFEFAVSVDAGITTLDHRGNSFSVRQGADLIEAAIRDLESSGFDTLKLRENLSRLQPVLTDVR
jgi:hypothetical protein